MQRKPRSWRANICTFLRTRFSARRRRRAGLMIIQKRRDFEFDERSSLAPSGRAIHAAQSLSGDEGGWRSRGLVERTIKISKELVNRREFIVFATLPLPPARPAAFSCRGDLRVCLLFIHALITTLVFILGREGRVKGGGGAASAGRKRRRRRWRKRREREGDGRRVEGTRARS